MKMALDDTAGRYPVTAYRPGEVRLGGRRFDRSLIVFPSRIEYPWPVDCIGALNSRALHSIRDEAPEIVILGTGDTQVFPPPGMFSILMDLGIGYEVMDNAAACRTYNILLAEGREVALALLMGRGSDA
jgi:uncharacterized protein